MPRDSPLLLYAKKHAKIEFHKNPIVILYKYMLYFITKLILGNVGFSSCFYMNQHVFSITGLFFGKRDTSDALHVYIKLLGKIFSLGHDEARSNLLKACISYHKIVLLLRKHYG